MFLAYVMFGTIRLFLTDAWWFERIRKRKQDFKEEKQRWLRQTGCF